MLPKDSRYTFTSKLPQNTFHSPLFTLRYEMLPRTTTGVAVVVSKKIDTRSVVRHKIKRQVIHIVQDLWHESKPPATLIFYAKKKILQEDQTTIKTEIERALKAANVI